MSLGILRKPEQLVVLMLAVVLLVVRGVHHQPPGRHPVPALVAGPPAVDVSGDQRP